MARKSKHPLIGITRPITQVRAPGRDGKGDGPLRTVVPGSPGHVWFGCYDPVIDVIALMTGSARAALPQPKYDTVDRPGQFGLLEYQGHDPYTMDVPIMFDRFRSGRSVEPEIRDLETLAERQPGTFEPPIIRTAGPVPHATLSWRVTDLEENQDRTQYLPTGERSRFALTVTLTQHITDLLLAETLGKVRTNASKRSTEVKKGEDSLYDVARRVYGDPSRASDIARANPGYWLAKRLKTGEKLRLPGP